MKQCFMVLGLIASCAAAQSPTAGVPVAPPLPPALNATVAFPRDVTMHGDIVYSTVRGFRPMTLDLYLPKSRTPLPLLIFVHGGAWAGGTARSAEIVGDNFPAMFAEFSAKGYAVASINYRLSSEARFPAQVQDLNAAIRFLRSKSELYGIDAQRVVVWGASAGAHIAMLSAFDCKKGKFEVAVTTPNPLSTNPISTCVSGLVDWFGPTTLGTQNPSPTALAYVGCAPAACADAWQRANVLESLTGDAPPLFIVHGDADTTVPIAQSKALQEESSDLTVKAQLKVVPNGNHLFRGAARVDIDAAIRDTFAFIEQQLQAKQ
jgi:acetyl esterase/lipase